MQNLEELRNKHLKPWSYYPFTHQDLEEGMHRIASFAMKKLSKKQRESILSRFTLLELFQELHRRANNDVEEDEEIDWEEEQAWEKLKPLFKRFPHF